MRDFGSFGKKGPAFRRIWYLALLRVGSVAIASSTIIQFLSSELHAQTYQSTPVANGFRAFNYDGGGVNNEPTQEKPESKLWHHDGYWWGVLWDPAPDEHSFKIHRFDPSTQNWTLVGPEVDDRRRSSADALWDGTKLYIASRAKETHKDSEGPDTAILNRYSYHAESDSFTLDPGFPVEIAGSTKTRALTITKDSNDRIWAVWTANAKIMVNRTLADDQTWGAVFPLPVQGNDLADIDLASVAAFGGDKVGILWGNQLDEKYYFSAHQDTDVDTLWGAREEALSDSILPEIADDHINLACNTNDGTLIAAVKTSTNGSDSPRVFVLKRDPVTGEWSRHIFGLGAEDHTRPIVLINSETDSVYVFARSKDLDAIVMKSAHIDDLDFADGDGTYFIESAQDPKANNPTSTKQCVNSESGILVLASAKDTKYYLHGYLTLSSNSSPVATADGYTTSEDSLLSVPAPGVIANDSDSDGDSLTVTLVSGPTSGTLALNSDGSLQYTPEPDFNGQDLFIYLLGDGKGGTDSAAVSLTITAKNDAPTAAADSYQVVKDSVLNVTVPGVLANDTDPDNEALAAILDQSPTNGSVTLYPNGSFTYSPNSGFAGTDSFSYSAEDPAGEASNLANVTIVVSEPVESSTLTFTPTDDVHANSSKPDKNYRTRDYMRVEQDKFNAYLRFDVQGVLGVVQKATLRLLVRGVSFEGGEAFAISNNLAGTTTPWSEETLTASNAPVISGSALVSFGEAPIDSFVEGDVTQAVSGNGIYSFAIKKSTSDRVEYHTKEGAAAPELVIEFASGTANDPPLASDDSAATIQGQNVDVDVTSNDQDPDGTIDPSSLQITMPPTNGVSTVDYGSGLVTYSPDPGFFGADSFAYVVGDNLGATSNVATVAITVSADTSISSFSFQPVDDAQVKFGSPTKNYGAKDHMKVDVGNFSSYLRFDVSGINGQIESARLRLYVKNSSDDGGSVFSVSNNFLGTVTPWTEEELNADNAPEMSGSPVAQIGFAPLNDFVEVDLSLAIFGEGIYSFGISPASTDKVEYSTKEGGHPPELIVDTQSGLAKRSSSDQTDEERQVQDDRAPLPQTVTLGPNYPNPFNAGTTISYSLPRTSKVELTIFNTRGQLVKTLVQGLQLPGVKTLVWDAKDNRGKEVSSGVYFLRLKIGSQNLARRMILQK